MKNQNLLKRTSNLLKSKIRDDKQAELLDQQIKQISLSSEESLPSRFQYEYSKQLIRSKKLVKIKKLQMTELRTGISSDEKITELQAEAERVFLQ